MPDTLGMGDDTAPRRPMLWRFITSPAHAAELEETLQSQIRRAERVGQCGVRHPAGRREEDEVLPDVDEHPVGLPCQHVSTGREEHREELLARRGREVDEAPDRRA